MAQRPIDRLAKRLLELRLPADVVPAHAWHLERQFAQSARFYQLQRVVVGPPDGLARQAAAYSLAAAGSTGRASAASAA